MQGYEEIFIQRGKSYHSAMEKYPHARDEEFKAIVEFLHLKPGLRLLDLPAGGGYLEKHLPDSLEYLAYDFSGEFDDSHSGIKKCKESKIDLPDRCVDLVVSLAALHHIVERDSFYGEMFRVLVPSGQFVLGDVVKGSKIDPFLNQFVNEYNSMGHHGRFIDVDRDTHELERAGFDVSFKGTDFYWSFDNEDCALDYFKKLFYLDKNPLDTLILDELIKLGIRKSEQSFEVQWSLGFLIAKKSKSR